MHSYIILSLIIAATAWAATPAAAQNAKRYEIKVNDFKHLEVDNSIKVDYYACADSAGYIVFEATPDLASRLYIRDNGKGKVDIQCCADCSEGMEFPVVKAYSKQLNKIVNSGDSLVTVNNNPEVEKFAAVLIGNGALSVRDVQATEINGKIASGNGQLSIDGACTKGKLSIIGTGTINADRLRAVEVYTSLTGTGTIGCCPSEVLSIQGLGRGKVLYRQEPHVIKDRSLGHKHEAM
ncbi:MAG: DUF2807 domain-containing protein [Muribaculaceae bacterium]|nr:DUF2807 domain-containing protein [Muribaculaceae bacterium]